MKNFKKIVLTGTITLATLLAMSAKSNAATVKVTGDVINIRKQASTSSSVEAMLSKGVECEYLGEEGDWYKVKYGKYTGYVSKQYTELVGDKPSNNSQDSTQTNNENKDDNKTNNQEGNNNNEQTNNNEQQNNDNKQDETNNLVYKKFNQKTSIRILPLVHSSSIKEAKKDEEVLVLSEVSGWSYVQTNEVSGWVRTSTLVESKKVTDTDTNKKDESNSTSKSSEASTSTKSNANSGTKVEKTGYINEEYVNVRSGAGTSYSVVKILQLNAQITVVEENGSWCKVKSGNTTGYVSKEFISDSKKVTSRSLSEPREEKEVTKKTDTTTKTSSTSTTTKNTSSTSNKTTTTNKTSNTSNNTNTSNKTNTSNSTSKNTIKGTDVIAYAKKYLGHKYVWGGDGSNGTFDCSGFTMYVYKHFGVNLPHYTVSQYNSGKGTKITKQSDLKMGDIVFLTDYETGAPCGHCGIYISDGNFIHADSTVMRVNISDLNGMYKGRFCGALRIIK